MTRQGRYTSSDGLVDYILGITYEIWEEGGLDLIDQYYSADCPVYSLGGIVRGAAAVIAGSRAVLAAYPDRLLFADDIIGEGDARDGYSSHRVVSPMSNQAATIFGPATGQSVRIMNMADCVVKDGVIVEEWLARDSLALVRQLGIDIQEAAKLTAQQQDDDLQDWMASERERLHDGTVTNEPGAGADPQSLLHAQWISGNSDVLDAEYPHYAVLHRSPIETYSGHAAIVEHYELLRRAFAIDAISVDNVCRRDTGPGLVDVAIRWAVCGFHRGDFLGIAATGKPVFVMGISHRRLVEGRIAAEWTVFDSLAVMAQLQ